MPTQKACNACGTKLKFWEGWSYVLVNPPEPTNRCTECERKHGLYDPVPKDPPNRKLFGA